MTARTQTGPLEPLEDPDEDLRLGEPEVGQLLGKARVHVVDELEPEQGLQEATEEDGLLMGMDEGVPILEEKPHRPQHDEAIEKELGQRRSDFHLSHEWNAGNADDPAAGDDDVLALTVREQVHLHTVLRHDHRAVVDAERTAGVR